MQRTCPLCEDMEGIVENFNIMLPPDKMIKVIDVSWDWGFDVTLTPLLNHVDIQGTPSIYLDGVLYEGFASREHLMGFLESFLRVKGEIKTRYFD